MTFFKDSNRYRFGPFTFDMDSLELWCNGALVPLTERPARLLRVLIRRAGSVVTKDELLDTAWDDVIVTEDALFHAVRELRQALKDEARDPVYVQTVHRRGYRFIAPAEPTPETSPANGSGNVVTSQAPVAVPPRRHELSRTSSIVWKLALGAAMVLGVLFLAPKSSKTSRNDPQLHELLRWRHGLFKPVYSPHGELLAAVAPDPATGVYSVFLIKPGLEDALQLTHDLDVRGPAPVFSPDGTRICFTTYSAGGTPTIWQVPILGTRPRPFLKGATAVSFDPGGQGFVYAAATASGSILRVRSADGTETVLAERGYWPSWSPDGRWIAWTTSDPEGGDGTLFVARPDGSEQRCLSPRRAQHYGLCWTPDSTGVVLATDRSGTFDLWLYPIDEGPPRPLTVGAGNATSPTIRDDGRRIVFCRGSKLDGVAVLETPISPPDWPVPRDHVARAVIGPGGKVAVVLVRPSGRVLEVSSREGNNLQRVGSGPIESVDILDDGGLLVTVHESSRWRVERWGPEAGQREILHTFSSEIDWSLLGGGGRWLLLVRRTPDGDHLVRHWLASSKEEVLATAAKIEAPRLSPDGRYVAFSGGYRPPSSEAAGVWVLPLDGSEKPRHLWPDGAWPCWEANGQQLVFARYFEEEGLWRIDVDGQAPERLRGSIEGLPLWFLDNDPTTGRLLAHLEVQSPTLWALDEPEL